MTSDRRRPSFTKKRKGEPALGLWSREIQEDHIRVLLHPFEDSLTAVWRDVEVANVEIGSEIGQPSLGARLQLEKPEILMLNVSSQKHECMTSMQEDQASSPASQGECRQGLSCGFCRDRIHRKHCADVGPRVDNEAAVGGPRGIDGVVPDKNSRGATVDRDTEEVWDAVIFCRGGYRLAIGRPRGIALQVERIGHDPRVRAVGLHHVQGRLPVLPDRECDMASIGGDCGAAKYLRSLTTPQLRGGAVDELPNTLARAGRRNI